MFKILFSITLCLAFAGCSVSPGSSEKAGLGIVPLGGATVTGKVIEASQPQGVLLKTGADRAFLLPQDWEYRRDGKTVPAGQLQPGSMVTAVAPAVESRLVSAADNTLVLGSDDGFFSFPVEGLPQAARAVPVQVQTTGGQNWDMPLGQAVQSYPGQIVSHPYYDSYSFPEADPYSVHKGVPVGVYGQSPLLLTPGASGAQLVRLPASYPRGQLASHQPVRFSYLDSSVSVSSWDTLGDGQFDLGELMLAGTLLDILPGQAVIEVGQNPVAVPWNYVTYQGQPIGPRRFPVGTPLGIQYYPGVYDVVSYDHGNLTLMYNHQPVQLPVSYLPDYSYRQPVRVRPYQQRDWVSMPFRDAQPLLHRGDYAVCPGPVAMPYAEYWHENRKSRKARPVRGRPDLHLVGQGGFWPPMVVRHGDFWPGDHRPDRRPGWRHTPNWAGPGVAWSPYPQPLVNWHGDSLDGRPFGLRDFKRRDWDGRRVSYAEPDWLWSPAAYADPGPERKAKTRQHAWHRPQKAAQQHRPEKQRAEQRRVWQHRPQKAAQQHRPEKQRAEQRRVSHRPQKAAQQHRPEKQRAEQRRVWQHRPQKAAQQRRPEKQRAEQRRVSHRPQKAAQHYRPEKQRGEQRRVSQRPRGDWRVSHQAAEPRKRGGGRDRR